MDENALSREVIEAAIEVHRELGPGPLESAYEICMCRELSMRQIEFRRQVEIPVCYKGVPLGCGYRADLVIQDKLVLELKAVEKLEPVHGAQLLTYLRLGDYRLGLLLNFRVPLMKNGVRRVVNNL